MPHLPHSPPMPDCLNPQWGARRLSGAPLTRTRPTRSCSATRRIRTETGWPIAISPGLTANRFANLCGFDPAGVFLR